MANVLGQSNYRLEIHVSRDNQYYPLPELERMQRAIDRWEKRL